MTYPIWGLIQKIPAFDKLQMKISPFGKTPNNMIVVFLLIYIFSDFLYT